MRHLSQNVNHNVYGTGLTFGKIDPLGQALMRPRRALPGGLDEASRCAENLLHCGSANRLQKSVEGRDTFRLAITGFYTRATNPNFR